MKYFTCLLFLSSAIVLQAQAPLPLDPTLGVATIPLYNGVPPNGTNYNAIDERTLTAFTPQPGRGTGAAIIIAPGGAYIRLVSNLEGRQIADWFTARGFTAFVLKYRLGPANIFPVPLFDAQRAVRLVRSLDKRYAISQTRIGIIGFSAGGHLAASVATSCEGSAAASSDPIDQLSCRPDFVVLGYPWLNAMEPAAGNEITYCSMVRGIAPSQCSAFTEEYSPRFHVTSHTPPVFMYSTSDDKVVPVSASIDFYSAMIKVGARGCAAQRGGPERNRIGPIYRFHFGKDWGGGLRVVFYTL